MYIIMEGEAKLKRIKGEDCHKLPLDFNGIVWKERKGAHCRVNINKSLQMSQLSTWLKDMIGGYHLNSSLLDAQC